MQDAELLNRKVGRQELQALLLGGFLKPGDLEQALKHSGLRPRRDEWKPFAYQHALALGALLLATGTGFFVAANWSELSFFGRLGVVGGALAVATLVNGFFRQTIAGRAAGVLGSLLFGPLLAIFGQTFQTGADPWQLFLPWTGVLVVYAATTKSAELGVLALGLLHLSVGAYLIQEQGVSLYREGSIAGIVSLAALDLLLAALFARHLSSPHRLLERTAALSALGSLLPFGLIFSFMEMKPPQLPGLLAFAFTLGALLWSSTKWRWDFSLLAISVAALVTCSSTLLGRVFVEGGELVGVFLLGLIVSGKVWFASRTLNRYRTQRQSETGS